MLDTVGHIDEGAGDYGQPFTPIMGWRGDESKACFCPCHEDFREYISMKYTLYAKTHPDFIWVDDDIKLFWNGVEFGCFCPGCLERFNEKTGSSYTRESLVKAMEESDNRELKALWVDDVSDRITELLCLIRESVRETDPGIELGFMTQHQEWSTFNGMDFGKWFKALGAVKGRPGEGYYEDSVPDDVCKKALSTARQAAEYPEFVRDIQYEVENFPYYRFQKSHQIILDECTLAAAQGMNGVLLNTLKIEPKAGLAEQEPLYEKILQKKGIWDRMESYSRGFQNYGFYTAFSHNYDRRRPLHGQESFFAAYYGKAAHDVTAGYGLGMLGVPLSADPSGSCGTILLGNLADGFTDEELLEMLGGACILDGSALAALEHRGFGKYTGVRLAGMVSDSIYEHFNMEDEINQGLEDEYRDTRTAFFGGTGYILQLLDKGVRELAALETYRGVRLGAAETLYENSLGGRICVLGYVPWKKNLSLCRRIQMMRICSYLTKGSLQAYIQDDCKASLFIRTNKERTKTMAAFLNMSLDTRERTRIAVRNASEAYLLRDGGKEEKLSAQKDGDYGIFELPSAGAI